MKKHILPSEFWDKLHTGAIKCDSVIIPIGSKLNNFVCEKLTIEPNYRGNPDLLRVSSCEVMHLEIHGHEGFANWIVKDEKVFTLETGSVYYLFARCLKKNKIGKWVITKKDIRRESERYYNLFVGIIHLAENGIRLMDLKYGLY